MANNYTPHQALKEAIDRIEKTNTFNPMEATNLLVQARCVLTELAQAKADLETERMRLAACGVAAIANTPGTASERIGRDSPYWSASYGDVCRAVDAEIAARTRAEAAEAALAERERVIRAEVLEGEAVYFQSIAADDHKISVGSIAATLRGRAKALRALTPPQAEKREPCWPNNQPPCSVCGLETKTLAEYVNHACPGYNPNPAKGGQ